MIANNDNKVFFISGGLNTFGKELTNQLLRDGHYVAVASESKEELFKTLESSYITDSNFLALEWDIADQKSIKKSIDEAITKFNQIDVIINNAGYNLANTVAELSKDDLIKMHRYCMASLILVPAVFEQFLKNNEAVEGSQKYPLNIIFVTTVPTNNVVEIIDLVKENKTVNLPTNLSIVTPGILNRNSDNEEVSRFKLLGNGNKATVDPIKGAASIIKIALSTNPPDFLQLATEDRYY